MNRISLVFLFVALVGCAKPADDGAKALVIGIVAKSQSNPVFQAAHAGAKAAAEELSLRRGVSIVLDFQTPPEESAEKQAAAIELLARAGASGIAVSCSDANTCNAAIDKAVELGSAVVCFDSDAPRSKRFAFYGADDEACGAAVLRELARSLDERGTIAILAGNPTAPNLQKRVAGVKAELAKYPELRLLDDGVFYHPETPEQAAEALARAQSTHPEIQGWALIGGWPLFTRGALKWSPGEIKVVSVDALPAELEYLKSGHVDVLLAQDCWGWGYRSVELLVERALDGKTPPEPRVVDPLARVTRADVDAWAEKWKQWLAR
ncbi:MAG: substrate-binding domain-containing protein [Planctomycetes bacterium]|nr:substrate-binding domain-containing protein [Planctomycetota bacterium]